ncbi:MAG: (4Fe-4S)-binding protein [Thermoplasmata archaeon]|nr:MAG: (4Fe-4S)-binding protein [Thermoplasmata archaeon]
MKQLTVISGKGGTGKTSITAAFASLANNAVFADCDVDAADLHLILKPRIKKTMSFHGLKIASIDEEDKCINCMKCYENCRFNAIDEEINVIEERCEGCGVCVYVCPTKAIELKDRESGFLYISETRFGPMSHAILKTAEEASGKLVTMVRENAKKLALEEKKDLIIIDGPPGIGCPVISAITGVDLVLIVTEPTLSAIHDLKRVFDVAKHFDIPSTVLINKYDINIDNTNDIIDFCSENDIPIVGRLPYDEIVTKAMVDGKTIIEYSNGEFPNRIKEIWMKTHSFLNRGV